MERHQKNGFEERRLHTRFPVKDWGAIAALGPKPLIVGKLLDISKSGLSVECLSDAVLNVNRAYRTEVSIYSIGKDFLMRNLACRCVYEEDAERPDFSMVLTKRYGIAFQALKKKQQSQLESFFDLQ